MLIKSASSHGLCRVKCEARLVALVYLVCLVELDQPDEQNKPDEPDQPVPPGSLAILRGRDLLSQTCGPLDFRRAGIVLSQPAGERRLGEIDGPTLPIDPPPGPCYSFARFGRF